MSTPQTVLGRALGSRHFVIAAAVLLVASVGSKKALKELHLVLAKKPVPLLVPLEKMPTSFGSRYALATEMDYPSESLFEGKYEMTSDVLETLGTDQTITWFYRDNERSTGKNLTYIRLHIAYYPQMLDPVPHVPDVCMAAAGYDPDPDAPARTVTWSADKLPAGWEAWRQTPIWRSAFVRKDARTVAFHVFSVNGSPVVDRVQVSAMLSDPRRKYCYYAKVELSAGSTTRALAPDEYDQICQAFWAAAAPEIFKHFSSASELATLEAAG
jgi:hypothetical protein